MAKEEKIKQVEKIAQGLKESSAVVFANYEGLSMVEMTTLRKKLSQLGAEIKVAKNTLVKLAAEKVKVPLEAGLSGPTAILFSKKTDPIESVKTVVSSFGEEAIKFGVFEGDLLEAAGVLELARIPSKSFLESRLVGTLQTPVAKLAFVLKGTQKNLVSVLTKVGEVRGGGSVG